MTSAICIAVVGVCTLFALHFCLNFPVVDSSRYIIDGRMDEKCNVYFNYTHFNNDTGKTYPNSMRIFSACWNDTKASVNGRNLTYDEINSCYWKCWHIADGLAKSDGTFNQKFVDKVKQQYEKYSNATTLYMDKIANKLTGCAKKVDEAFNSPQKNGGANSGLCRINWLYQKCFWQTFGTQAMNATKEEACGYQ